MKRAAKRYAAAKTERDETITEAAAAGITRPAIGALVGISHQRVQQIVTEGGGLRVAGHQSSAVRVRRSERGWRVRDGLTPAG